ncbi:hypothetical protein TorRG33x02_004730 [Trema orientale]|uniref:Uncharacterized protein n=1 Tax=Trema orientale TaxID=63057 RepID=A0A2P5G2C7_TREOI|nr:hypothetical protein TorRG33x02_004730 [Trema orientale]
MDMYIKADNLRAECSYFKVPFINYLMEISRQSGICCVFVGCQCSDCVEHCVCLLWMNMKNGSVLRCITERLFPCMVTADKN